MIGGDRERLLSAAKAEKDSDLRHEAIDQLRVLEAKNELWQLYGAETDLEVDRKILDALWLCGQDKLLSVAQKEPDRGLRRKAMELLGHMDSKQIWLARKAGKKAAEAIANAVENDPETGIKRKAVFALSQLPKEEGIPRLIQVARTNRNREVLKEAIFWLGQSKDIWALDCFEDILTE